MSDVDKNARLHMEKTISALKSNFARVRSGRANPHILDSVRVDYYGMETPIAQLAAIKVPEATMIVVEPWDKSSLNAIEKAIRMSDLGVNPSNDGSVIRIPFPAPTEERRRELVKECRGLAEDARVAIRNIRRDANNRISRDEELSEDQQKGEQKKIQKLTDDFIKEIDGLLKTKEAEVMEI